MTTVGNKVVAQLDVSLSVESFFHDAERGNPLTTLTVEFILLDFRLRVVVLYTDKQLSFNDISSIHIGRE